MNIKGKNIVGMRRFIEILEKTKLPKCNGSYTDYEGSYCSMGAVMKELGFDPADSEYRITAELKMKRELGFDPYDFDGEFFPRVIEINDEICGEPDRDFKCVAKELRKEFNL